MGWDVHPECIGSPPSRLLAMTAGLYLSFRSRIKARDEEVPNELLERKVRSAVRSPSDPVNTGGIYDPATGNWTPTALSGAPSAGSDSPAVWTGDRMVIWRGAVDAAVLGDGALYNLIADSWESTSTVNAPSPRAEHTAVWSGSSVIVWGGKGAAGAPTDTGGRLDPVANGRQSLLRHARRSRDRHGVLVPHAGQELSRSYALRSSWSHRCQGLSRA